MRRRYGAEVKLSGLTANYAPNYLYPEHPRLQEHIERTELMYPRMFIQDVSNGLLPLAFRSDKDSFSVTLDQPNESVEEIIAVGLSSTNSWALAAYRDLKDALPYFLKECAQRVITFGSATYEIVFAKSVDSNSTVGFELKPVTPKSIVVRKGKVYQYFPEAIAKILEKPQYVEVHPDSLITFSLHKDFQKSYFSMIEALAVLSQDIVPRELSAFDEQGRRMVPFNVQEFKRAESIALARVVKDTGWNARALFAEQSLEFYQLHRVLRFECFKADFRNSLISSLNKALQVIGKEMNFEVTLRLLGVLEPSDIQSLLTKLEQGALGFEDVLKKLRLTY